MSRKSIQTNYVLILYKVKTDNAANLCKLAGSTILLRKRTHFWVWCYFRVSASFMSGILDQRSAMPVHYGLGRFVSHFGL